MLQPLCEPGCSNTLATNFRQVCETAVEDDGLTFDAASVRASRIRDSKEYEGVRITLGGELAGARLNLQVDVGFGDVITPAPIHIELPTLLNQPRPLLATYPRETALAEKLHVIVTLGMSNSRMKDFFDIDFLAAHFPFEGQILTEAVRATFERRRTPLPTDMPTAFTDLFTQDPTKQAQWRAFLRKSGLEGDMSLVTVVERVKAFAWPVLEAARQEKACGFWSTAGVWTLLPPSALPTDQ
jgi:hypothetical protein